MLWGKTKYFRYLVNDRVNDELHVAPCRAAEDAEHRGQEGLAKLMALVLIPPELELLIGLEELLSVLEQHEMRQSGVVCK